MIVLLFFTAIPAMADEMQKRKSSISALQKQLKIHANVKDYPYHINALLADNMRFNREVEQKLPLFFQLGFLHRKIGRLYVKRNDFPKAEKNLAAASSLFDHIIKNKKAVFSRDFMTGWNGEDQAERISPNQLITFCFYEQAATAAHRCEMYLAEAPQKRQEIDRNWRTAIFAFLKFEENLSGYENNGFEKKAILMQYLLEVTYQYVKSCRENEQLGIALKNPPSNQNGQPANRLSHHAKNSELMLETFLRNVQQSLPGYLLSNNKVYNYHYYCAFLYAAMSLVLDKNNGQYIFSDHEKRLSQKAIESLVQMLNNFLLENQQISSSSEGINNITDTMNPLDLRGNLQPDKAVRESEVAQAINKSVILLDKAHRLIEWKKRMADKKKKRFKNIFEYRVMDPKSHWVDQGKDSYFLSCRKELNYITLLTAQIAIIAKTNPTDESLTKLKQIVVDSRARQDSLSHYLLQTQTLLDLYTGRKADLPGNSTYENFCLRLVRASLAGFGLPIEKPDDSCPAYAFCSIKQYQAGLYANSKVDALLTLMLPYIQAPNEEHEKRPAKLLTARYFFINENYAKAAEHFYEYIGFRSSSKNTHKDFDKQWKSMTLREKSIFMICLANLKIEDNNEMENVGTIRYKNLLDRLLKRVYEDHDGYASSSKLRITDERFAPWIQIGFLQVWLDIRQQVEEDQLKRSAEKLFFMAQRLEGHKNAWNHLPLVLFPLEKQVRFVYYQYHNIRGFARSIKEKDPAMILHQKLKEYLEN